MAVFYLFLKVNDDIIAVAQDVEEQK